MQEVRAKYIAAFREVLRELQDEGRKVTPEVRVEVDIARTRDLYRLRVIDVLEQKPDGTVGAIEINCDEIPTAHAGVRFDTPVVWNGVVVRCREQVFREADLVAWANRWIHDESPPRGPQDGLTGVIHSVTEPTAAGGVVEFSVDFGSAPLEAFDELLACLDGAILSVASQLSDHGA